MDIDIFAPVPCPEPYSLDLVFIASRFSTHGLTRPASPNTSTTTRTAPAGTLGSSDARQPTPSINTSNVRSDTRFNCTLCKKSFGTEATWNNHQKSAKHQAAVKEAEKKAKAAGSKKTGGGGGEGQNKGGSRPATNSSSTEKPTPQSSSPELSEALQSLQKAEKAAKTHPALVAPVLWKTVKVLWAHKMYQDTKDGLLLLISILQDLQKANNAGEAPQQGNLTPTQINLTLYLARLATARLTIYENPLDACRYYVDAIQGRWQMPHSTFQTYSEKIGLVPPNQLLMQIHGFLENHDKTQKLVCSTEQAPAPAPKKQPDPNLKLLTILTEMGSLLAQSKLQISMDSRQPRYNITPEEKTQAEFSLTALYMASNIARFDTEQGIALEPTLVRRRAAVYEHLGMLHYASHCYSETSVMPGCTLADREWDEFRSLLLAMEADDPIRTTLCLKRTAMPVAYLDAQVLIMLADAIETADVDVLENDVRTHIDHLRLLVKTDAADQLLMAKYCSQTELMKIVDRIHKLIPS